MVRLVVVVVVVVVAGQGLFELGRLDSCARGQAGCKSMKEPSVTV